MRPTGPRLLPLSLKATNPKTNLNEPDLKKEEKLIMRNPLKILAIPGSVRASSFNRGLLVAARNIDSSEFEIEIYEGLADLPKLMADARQAMAGIQQTMATADENLNNLKGFTEPLGERGAALVMSIESSFNQLDQLVGQLALFSRAINNREGSLGQLVHNPELYQNLNRAVVNIERISRQLRPIINDVRIFTDKIARDPGRLGVRGALRQPSGIK